MFSQVIGKNTIKSYTEAFITRLKDLKEDKGKYKEQIDFNELQKAVELLNEQEAQLHEGIGFDPKFFEIYKIISLYTTFILVESVIPLELHSLVVLKLNMKVEFIYVQLKRTKRIILELFVDFALPNRMKICYKF